MDIKTICLNSKEIINFYYDKSKEKEIALFNDFSNEYSKLLDYFKVNPPKIKVKFAYSGVEFDKFCKIKDCRFVAMVDNKDPQLVYMFSPTVYEKEVGIPKKRMIIILAHEVSHIFVTEINKRCFAWMNEGICEVVSGATYKNTIKKSNWNKFKKELINPDIDWYDQAGRQGYEISYNLVKYIISKCGKETIFNLLRIRRAKSNTLKSRMSKIIGQDFDKFIIEFEKTLIFN